ncbi:MAG TPA: Rid family hydrolase [Streptosporangiaceae bacterium]
MTKPETLPVAPVQSFDAGIARQIGHYSDAVRVPAGYDHLIVSGTPGLAPDGTLPADMTRQATRAWRNIEMILHEAGAALADIVAVRQWLTSSDDIADYVAVRSSFLTHKPAFMLAVIPALVRPGFLVEVEVTAAVPQKDPRP